MPLLRNNRLRRNFSTLFVSTVFRCLEHSKRKMLIPRWTRKLQRKKWRNQRTSSNSGAFLHRCDENRQVEEACAWSDVPDRPCFASERHKSFSQPVHSNRRITLCFKQQILLNISYPIHFSMLYEILYGS